MVRGISAINPIWQLALSGSPIEASWGKGPQVSFAEPVANMAKSFMAGLNAGDEFVGRRETGRQIQDIANNPNSPAAQLLGMGAQGGVYGGTGSDSVTSFSRSVPTFAQGGAGSTPKSMPSSANWNAENRQAIIEEAQAAGYNPEDLATVMSYETAGSMDPWKAGPRTKWGQHRGLIQWGEPQRQQYGVTENTSFRDQVKASIRYLQDRGLKPGMGMLEMYSAINAGGIGPQYYGRSDTAAGGAPGTVADKVNSQMGAHRKRVQAWFGQDAGMPAPGAVVAPAPTPSQVAASQPASQPVPAQGQPASVQQQAQEVLAAPDQYDPRTVQWAQGVVGNQQTQQPAAAPQLAPSPNDREIASAVTQNQVATVQQGQGAPRPPTFMGLPTQAPGGNVNPQAPQMAGGQGDDILMGGAGGGSPAQAPAPAPLPPPGAGAPPPPPRAAPPQYRAPIRQAGPEAIDPRILRALGTAVASGDANSISAVQSLLRQGGGQRGSVVLEQLPDGSTVLVDQATGEVSPYSGPSGSTKAPEVREINGVSHQWTGQGWAPLGGGQPGAQFRLVTPQDTAIRQSLNIDPSDKRTYQIDIRTGKADPINEQRAVDDKTYQQETGLREKFEGITKDNRAALDAYSRIQAATADLAEHGPSPASDMGLVFGLMKMYDPTSVVRETEYANAQNAGSAPERITNVYNKVLEGTILTPAQRADFMRQAYNLQRENVKIFNGQAKRYQKLAQSYGLRPEMVADTWEEPGATPSRAEVRAQENRSGVARNAEGEVEVVSEKAAENLKLPKGTVIRFTAGPLKGKRAVVE